MSDIEPKGLRLAYNGAKNQLMISWYDYPGVQTYSLGISKLVNDKYVSLLKTSLSSNVTSYAFNNFSEGVDYKIVVIGFYIDGKGTMVVDRAKIKINDAGQAPIATSNSRPRTASVATPKLYKREGKQIIFGSYPHSLDGRELPIIWDVIEETNGFVSMISHQILDVWLDDSKKYEDSGIREWLNNEFYNKAFNSAEKGIILTTNVKTRTGVVNDKVCILSIKAVGNLFDSDQARRATATEYAKSKGLNRSALYPTEYIRVIQGYSPWWVRVSYSDYTFDFTTVTIGGNVDFVGDNYCGVRPVISIKK